MPSCAQTMFSQLFWRKIRAYLESMLYFVQYCKSLTKKQHAWQMCVWTIKVIWKCSKLAYYSTGFLTHGTSHKYISNDINKAVSLFTV